jgi:hypothetical protein
MEEFLFCQSVTNNTQAKDVVFQVDLFMNEKCLTWTQCFILCTDGGSAAYGERKGSQYVARR